MNKKSARRSAKTVKSLKVKNVGAKQAKAVKGGMPQGPPNRQIPPGPPI